MKINFSYRLFAVIIPAIVLYGCIRADSSATVKVPRMNPKYGYRDKEPMGSYMAYHYANSMFSYGITNVINKPFAELRYEINYNKSIYIILAKSIFLSQEDLESMMNYVSNGNTIFISAEYIDRRLIDTLGAHLQFNFTSVLPLNEFNLEKKDTWLTLAHESAANAKKYSFYFVPFLNNFSDFDSTATQVLGFNEVKETNFIAIDHGQGKFILHAAPAAFSNYFLLTGNNKEYFEKIFSYFNYEANSVYWDNYYRLRIRQDDEDFSIVNFFKKHPPLYYAFWLTLAALLIFIAFAGKRRQRLVPERIPNTNTTVSYTQTIGRLYLQKKDNRNIALKMFTYFLEFVRNNYYLNTQTLNDDFAEALSRKSGVPETKVKHLLQLIDETDRSDSISDIRLLELHNLLQEYFKK